MSEVVLVESQGTTFLVEVSDGGGVGTVGLDSVMSFDGVADTVTAGEVVVNRVGGSSA